LRSERECPQCGHVSADNRTQQAIFACLNCGYSNHADVVAANNILARGLRVIACGELQGRSTKQEPSKIAA
jgi:putative transposase